MRDRHREERGQDRQGGRGTLKEKEFESVNERDWLWGVGVGGLKAPLHGGGQLLLVDSASYHISKRAPYCGGNWFWLPVSRVSSFQLWIKVHDHRWEYEHRSASKSRASSFGFGSIFFYRNRLTALLMPLHQLINQFHTQSFPHSLV